MTTRWLLIAALLLFGAGAPGPAAAQTIAYAAPGSTNLRTGPGTRYPVIARVPGGSRLYVEGCLEDGSWCAVVFRDLYGWMYAGRLQFVYGGELVYLPRYYAYFGAPVIRFDFGYRKHWRDRRHRRQWQGNIETECLAPEGFCPGERPRPNTWRRDDYRGGGGRLIVPPPETFQPDAPGPGASGNVGVPTECLAPDGFCP